MAKICEFVTTLEENKCIYCCKRFAKENLTDEHVLPKKISVIKYDGTYLLKNAVCYSCQKKTNPFEQAVIKNMVSMRMKMGARIGQESLKNMSCAEKKVGFIVFPRFEMASIFWKKQGIAQQTGLKTSSVDLITLTTDFPEKNYLASYSGTPLSLARFLAKIAHGLAIHLVHEANKTNSTKLIYKSYLHNFILDGNTEVDSGLGFYIGTEPFSSEREQKPHSLHFSSINLPNIRNPEGEEVRFIGIYIQLFPGIGAPFYHVVPGYMEETKGSEGY